jgi:hypothetical protein
MFNMYSNSIKDLKIVKLLFDKRIITVTNDLKECCHLRQIVRFWLETDTQDVYGFKQGDQIGRFFPVGLLWEAYFDFLKRWRNGDILGYFLKVF